jgi:hypothetical protein
MQINHDQDGNRAAKHTTITVSKHEKHDLDWLVRATANDLDGSILNTVSRQGNITLATNGYCLHVIETPDCLEQLTNTNPYGQANYRPSDVHVTLEQEVETRYPNVAGVIPKEEPIAQACINPRYLFEALEGFRDEIGVRISIYKKNGCPLVSVQSTQGVKRYALVIGMVPATNAKEPWTPSFEERDARSPSSAKKGSNTDE